MSFRVAAKTLQLDELGPIGGAQRGTGSNEVSAHDGPLAPPSDANGWGREIEEGKNVP